VFVAIQSARTTEAKSGYRIFVAVCLGAMLLCLVPNAIGMLMGLAIAGFKLQREIQILFIFWIAQLAITALAMYKPYLPFLAGIVTTWAELHFSARPHQRSISDVPAFEYCFLAIACLLFLTDLIRRGLARNRATIEAAT
jgi:hypothetical protein